MRGTVALLPILLLALVSTTARAEEPRPFSTSAWQQAADPSLPDWSRRDLLQRFAAGTTMEGMPRDDLLRRLGAPGIAEEIYYPGQGLGGRIDFYRLSAKNEDSFRVDYDEQSKVTGDAIEASPCVCTICKGAAQATSVAAEKLDAVLKPAADGKSASLDFAALEHLIGAGARFRDETPTGGQMWVSYTEVWRLAGEDGAFFIAAGRDPRTEQKTFDAASVADYALVREWPECLPPHS
jgi:hypothetical protein